jgi:hypothetical protein
MLRVFLTSDDAIPNPSGVPNRRGAIPNPSDDPTMADANTADDIRTNRPDANTAGASMTTRGRSANSRTPAPPVARD